MGEPEIRGNEINRLPPEMLSKIFFEVGETRSPRVREVCKNWNECFDHNNEIQLEVNNFNWKDLKNCKNKKMSVTFRNFTRTLDLIDGPTMDPLHIQNAELTVPLVSYNLAILLKHCVNLKSLNLNNCRLDFASDPRHFEEFNIDEILLPRLKTLNYTFHSPYVEDLDHLIILLKRVLINTKPSHFNFDVRTFQCHFHDDLLKLILAPGNNVETEKRSINAPHYHAFLTDHIKTIQSIGFKSKYGRGPIFWIRSFENSTWPVQIEELNTGGWNEFFPYLFERQHLTKLTMPGDSWIPFSSHVHTFGAKLTNIALDCRYPSEFDCQAFQTCVALRNLLIYRSGPGNPPICDLLNRHLLNCHLLPSSLRSLKTSATPYYTDPTFRDISFENLKGLENLELCCYPYLRVGTKYESWMDQANFDYFLKSLSNLSNLKLQVTNRVTCIPEAFVRHIENTPGLHFTMGYQNQSARIHISTAFRTEDEDGKDF